MNYEVGEVVTARVNWTGLDGKLHLTVGTKYKIIHVFPNGDFLIIDNTNKEVVFEEHEIEFFFGEKTDPYEHAMDLL